MKTQLILLSTALFLAQSFQFNAKAKDHSTEKRIEAAAPGTSFSFLKTHRQGKGVTATWAITSTEGVVCFSMQKTYEDPNDQYAYWEDVDVVACDQSRSFKYNDTNVFAGSVNYRVIAHMTDGSTVVSEISSIRIMSRG